MAFRGLINNGCTCYINASLQALFHCSSARNTVLGLPWNLQEHERLCAADAPPTKGSDATSVSALQYLFFEMQYSIRHCIPTKQFCKSLGMTEADMLEYRDANEFVKQILDKIEVYCKGQNDNDALLHYQHSFVGTQESIVVCKKCGRQSSHVQPFTDLMLPIRQDFYHSLAEILFPERLDGYLCSKCYQKQHAIKYMKIKYVPDVLQITLQRFHIDRCGDMHKDSSVIHLPLFMDLFMLLYINMDRFDDDSTIEQYQQALQVAMMPWLYFEVVDGKVTAKKCDTTVQTDVGAFLRVRKFTYYFKQYYSDYTLQDPFQAGAVAYPGSSTTVSQENTTCHDGRADETLFPAFPAGHTPPGYYQLTAVSCHSGSLNQGHYYALVLAHAAGGPTGLSMYECNDCSVRPIADAPQRLRRVAGRSAGKAGQSNTGYMYFYERAACKGSAAPTVCCPAVLHRRVSEGNQLAKAAAHTVRVRAYSNYDGPSGTLTVFGDGRGAEFAYDLHESAVELVRRAAALLGVPELLCGHRAALHQCRPGSASRERLLVGCAGAAPLPMCPTGPAHRQGSRQCLPLTLFIEFVPEGAATFDYGRTYVLATRAACGVATSHIVALDRATPNQHAFGLPQLKAAIASVDPQATGDYTIVYARGSPSGRLLLCNCVHGSWLSDAQANVSLQNYDELFYEILPVRIPAAILAGQPTVQDFIALPSEILHYTTTKQLAIVRVNDYTCAQIRTWLLSPLTPLNDLLTRLKIEVAPPGPYGTEQVKVHLTVREKGTYRIVSFYFKDKTVADLMTTLNEEYGLQTPPDCFYLTYFLNKKQEEEFETNRKTALITEKAPRQPPVAFQGAGDALSIKVVNQDTGMTKHFEYAGSDPIVKMFKDFQTCFDSKIQHLVATSCYRCHPSEVNVEILLRYFGNLPIRRLTEVYFNATHHPFAFQVVRKKFYPHTVVNFIVQTPEQPLTLKLDYNVVASRVPVLNKQTLGSAIKKAVQPFNPPDYHIYIYKDSERRIHFDFNEVTDVFEYKLYVDFKGEFYVLLDRKGELVVHFENYFKDRYQKCQSYSYVTIFYKNQYGRIRAFSDLSVQDVVDFFMETYKCKVKVKIKADKPRTLPGKQLLVQKVYYGLFMCVDV